MSVDPVALITVTSEERQVSEYVKQSVIGINTCPKMHEHGAAKITLSYRVDNPLVFWISANLTYNDPLTGKPAFTKRVVHEFYRESVFFWLVNAPGGSVHELGDRSFKIRLSMPSVVCVKFPPIPWDGDDVTISPMIMLSREALQHFLADTYVAVPAETECDVLDLDGCIEKILTGGKK